MTRSGRKQEPRSTTTRLLARKRVLICVGAGGTGKTTLAAALAVRAARSGRRVACLTIDPARRLADSLGVGADELDGGLTDITERLGSEHRSGGRLSFGMLDPKETFNAFVRRRASSTETAERILDNKLYRYVSGSLSGMHEYMALEKLCELRNDDQIELVVLDTPPTANALDFFTAPRRMVEALDGKLVRVMRRAYGGPGRVGIDLVGRWARAVLRAISRVTGAELLGEMMGFVDALSDLFGSFAERARAVEEVLRGGDVAFCLITTPDKSTLREARQFRQRLFELGLVVDVVAFNRAHWPQADAPPPELDAGLVAELEPLTREWNADHERERVLVDQVRAAWAGLEAVVVVPLLPEGAVRIDSLDRIGSYL
jgi:anion-transporting  ArsA/GET3 family ATPase